jgi:hypothetical protein
VHFLLVAIISTFFFTTTEFSRVGDNAWQSMAQGSAPVPPELVASFNTMTNGEVRKWLIAAGMKKKFVKLAGWRDGDQEEIRLRGLSVAKP